MEEKIPLVMCICAHSDDQIFGPGGTLAKYAREGKKVFTIILSYGEMSHPHFKEEVIIKTRVDESKKADRVLGGDGVIFLGLKEGKFVADAHERGMIQKLAALIKLHHPEKILTHASDDPHPDHRAAFRLVKESYELSEQSCPVYTFDVWTPFSTKKRDAPKLVVDVSDQYSKKLKAISCFRSQLGVLQFLNWYVYARMLIANSFAGLRRGYRFAEVFYRWR